MKKTPTNRQWIDDAIAYIPTNEPGRKLIIELVESHFRLGQKRGPKPSNETNLVARLEPGQDVILTLQGPPYLWPETAARTIRRVRQAGYRAGFSIETEFDSDKGTVRVWREKTETNL